MDQLDQHSEHGVREMLEPMDDWLHLQPSIDEERKGRIYLPANVDGARLTRCLVLASGDQVSDLTPGDVVLALSSKTIDLRDGTTLIRREYVIARMH
jgi:hypothetical protein